MGVGQVQRGKPHRLILYRTSSPTDGPRSPQVCSMCKPELQEEFLWQTKAWTVPRTFTPWRNSPVRHEIVDLQGQ
ncbi:hypothetical protein AOLI_G00046410 [Acnodon oligacanthus]